jgi:hypothetical protein
MRVERSDDRTRNVVLCAFVPLFLALTVTLLTSGTSGASTKTVTDAKYGLSFNLPDQWQEIPLTGSDITGLLDLVTKADPSMKSSLTKEVKQAAKTGIKIFALGPISDDFASNLNVIVEPLAGGPSTAGYFDQLGLEAKLNLAGAGMKKIVTSKVHWSQGEILQAKYTLHLSTSKVSVQGIQDYVWHKGNIFIVTFSSSKLSTDKAVAKIVSRSWHWG